MHCVKLWKILVFPMQQVRMTGQLVTLCPLFTQTSREKGWWFKVSIIISFDISIASQRLLPHRKWHLDSKISTSDANFANKENSKRDKCLQKVLFKKLYFFEMEGSCSFSMIIEHQQTFSRNGYQVVA